MTDEQSISNGNAPATQHDLSVLAGHVTGRLDIIESRMVAQFGQVNERFDDLEDLVTKSLRVQESLLTTINSIDGRLREITDHEERLQRLERATFDRHS